MGQITVGKAALARRKLVAQFKKDHKRDPSPEELDQIEKAVWDEMAPYLSRRRDPWDDS